MKKNNYDKPITGGQIEDRDSTILLYQYAVMKHQHDPFSAGNREHSSRPEVRAAGHIPGARALPPTSTVAETVKALSTHSTDVGHDSESATGGMQQRRRRIVLYDSFNPSEASFAVIQNLVVQAWQAP